MGESIENGNGVSRRYAVDKVERIDVPSESADSVPMIRVTGKPFQWSQQTLRREYERAHRYSNGVSGLCAEDMSERIDIPMESADSAPRI